MLSIVLVVLAQAPDAAPVVKVLEAQGYVTKVPAGCANDEDAFFAAKAVTCVTAKAKAPFSPKDPKTFARLGVRLQRFADEATAYARLQRLRELPKTQSPELQKSAPLRAAFQKGELVVVVQSDAFLFEPELQRVAKVLSSELGGGAVMCWGPCPK